MTYLRKLIDPRTASAKAEHLWPITFLLLLIYNMSSNYYMLVIILHIILLYDNP